LSLDNAAAAAAAAALASSSETFDFFPSSSSSSFSSEPGSNRPKRILSLSMPTLTEIASARKRSVAEHGARSLMHPTSLLFFNKKNWLEYPPYLLFLILIETRLASELEGIGRAYPRHLVILAGSRRQDGPEPVPSPAPPTGGILTRYQLLTPALITGLLLAIFVLVPVVLFGVSALASIQSPLRVQPPKGYSADEKKNQ
jgi:hypothetical protein